MIKLGSLDLGGSPKIAVGFRDKVLPETIKEGVNHGLDIAEIRIDQFSSYAADYVLGELDKFKLVPTIATIRSEQEGGTRRLSDSQRLALFKLVSHHVDAIDIELSSETILDEVVKIVHEVKKMVVISYHNFDETPPIENLMSIFSTAKSAGADIVKIATQVTTRHDIQTLARFTIDNAEKNIIVIGMGAEGLSSRFFLPALGSLITFAYIGQPSAPGQLHFNDTLDLLRKFYPSYNQEKISSLKLVENF